MSNSVINMQVLVLNKFWQAVNITDVGTAISMMFSGVATGVDCAGEDDLTAVKWDEWRNLPIRENDKKVSASKFAVRAPTVVIACNYEGIPKRIPNFETKNIAKRDKYICQYSGDFAPDGNVDHVIPRSRGGKDSWENVAWCRRDINTKKADKTPEEAGLRLLKSPKAPIPVPIELKVEVRADTPDWKKFLIRYK